MYNNGNDRVPKDDVSTASAGNATELSMQMQPLDNNLVWASDFNVFSGFHGTTRFKWAYRGNSCD